MLVSSDDRAIDVVQIPVQVTAPLGFFQQGSKDLFPDALLSPTPKPAVDGLPGSVALRQITPRSTRTRQPEDGIDK